MNPAIMHALQQARRAEKEQALFYHALVKRAEQADALEEMENLSGLHADEQHHLSRLSVRLLELDQDLVDLGDARAPEVVYPDWQGQARAREQAELARSRALGGLPLDAATAALIADIIAVEEQHAQTLGGKYMSA